MKKWSKHGDQLFVFDNEVKKALQRLSTQKNVVVKGHIANDIGQMFNGIRKKDLLFIGQDARNRESGIFLKSPYIKIGVNGNKVSLFNKNGEKLKFL